MPENLKSPSIKDALQGKLPGDDKLSAKEQHEIYTNSRENEDFTELELKEKWMGYVNQLDDKPNLKSTLLKIPKIENGYQLILQIDNSVQENNVKNIQPELVSWLRKELKNSNINLITKIEENKEGRIIYTDDEKYKEMVKKNPSLALFRKKFNLDFGE